MAKLDGLVTDALLERLLTPERLREILYALREKRKDGNASAQPRISDLAQAISEAEEKLNRIYAAIEDGVIELSDPTLKARLDHLKVERDRSQAALDRAREETREAPEVDPVLVDRFARLMRENLASGEVPFRKAYLRRSSIESRWINARSASLASGICWNVRCWRTWVMRLPTFAVLFASGAPLRIEL
jgi:chromosome segregation ATPase